MKTAAWVNKTASAAVLSGEGSLYSVVLTAGSDAATATVYDNTSGSGTVICKLGAATGETVQWSPGVRLPVSTGIYVALSGTGPSCSIAYSP